jgi:hypothetical protein
MPVMHALNPDGTPSCPRGYPCVVEERRDERRQLLSLTRDGWATPRGIPQPPPDGALVRIGDDPEPAFRYERLPVLDASGEVVATRCEWVDLRERRRAEREAAHIAAAKAARKKGAQ